MSLARLGFVPVLGLLPLLGFGCSDPAPPTPRAAYSLNFVKPGASCNVGGHSEVLGEVTAARRLRVVADGDEGASVDCTVTGSGSFDVSATLKNSATATQVRIKIVDISPGATKEMPASGSVSFSSAKTSGTTFTSTTDEQCQFWFDAESEQGVDAGKIWVVFECPSVTDGQYTCEIRRGALALDSCGS
ncbi:MULTISPECIES: hypothetical protein [Sorangium]|uniref:Uncharacterized protein n=1 Tax=Sorangium cellulosum TaxID=56 RepID=A0A4P2QYB9_SORCE|nr:MULTISPECIES: hypothetical protein [Sorangium]AUX35577.1 hypothetical protein SOCE836_077720 [Sorangium cellulosum]WCQ94877.1 hypothetical protein NQZ70_07650 [Sorangium sp. Soce836]